MIGAVPAHELVKAAEVCDELGTRRQQQVERVAEDQLVAERRDVAGLERLDRSLGRERHERRRTHVAVGEMQSARAGARVRSAGPDREHGPDPTWEREERPGASNQNAPGYCN